MYSRSRHEKELKSHGVTSLCCKEGRAKLSINYDTNYENYVKLFIHMMTKCHRRTLLYECLYLNYSRYHHIF